MDEDVPSIFGGFILFSSFGGCGVLALGNLAITPFFPTITALSDSFVAETTGGLGMSLEETTEGGMTMTELT